MSSRFRVCAATLLAASLGASPVYAQTPDTAELYRIIQELQRQVEALKAQVAGQPGAPAPAAEQADLQRQVQEQQKQIEALAQQAEASKQADWVARTKIGGYGELHYNNLEGEGAATDLEQIDLHRFVLFFGHSFSDQIRFFSELEVEHAFIQDRVSGTASPGEVEVEQAYVEFDINNDLQAKGGLFLIPVGILNETHEPPTFYGVERNPVENQIIPSTWWAGGAGLTWRFGEGWALDAAVHEGLRITNANFAIRGGRQRTANAVGEDLASTVRVKWTGVPGLELAATVQYQADVTQSQNSSGDSANLYEAHAIYQNGPFGLRALYAAWDLDGSGPAAVGADEQEGYYIEPSWRFNPQWGAFVRYNQWDNQAGSSGPGNTENTQYDVGVNYWPIENVVLKADYQQQDNDSGNNRDGFNLGIGYQF